MNVLRARWLLAAVFRGMDSFSPVTGLITMTARVRSAFVKISLMASLYRCFEMKGNRVLLSGVWYLAKMAWR